MSEPKMTKELHLKLVEAWWDGRLELSAGDGRWMNADKPPCANAYAPQFRIRPQHKLRPWRPEEVPVGAQVKSFDGKDRSLIVAVNCQQFWIGSGEAPIPFGFAREYFVHSIDGGKTWKPCGVEESQ